VLTDVALSTQQSTLVFHYSEPAEREWKTGRSLLGPCAVPSIPFRHRLVSSQKVGERLGNSFIGPSLALRNRWKGVYAFKQMLVSSGYGCGWWRVVAGGGSVAIREVRKSGACDWD
jgi:hypothetical protein